MLKAKELDSTLESLAHSGAERFKSLDLKLATAIKGIVKNNNAVMDLQQTFISAATTAWRKDKSLLTGRQLLWLMFRYLRTNSTMDIVYSVTDLEKLKWTDDNKAHTFLHYWDYIIQGMKNKLPEDTLEDMLATQLRKSPEMKMDMAHYDRCEHGEKDKCYQYLRRCITRLIEAKQLTKNRQSIVDAFSGKLNHLHPKGAPAPKSAKAKNRAKAKAKAAEESAANALAAKGAGKGQPKARSRKPNAGDDTPICWFFNCGAHTPNVGKCHKTAKECKFKHKKVSLEEFNRMEKPSRSRSTSRDPKGKGKGKGKGKSKSKGQSDHIYHWCRDHLKEGGCSRGKNCKFPHLSSDAIEACKTANANAKKSS